MATVVNLPRDERFGDVGRALNEALSTILTRQKEVKDQEAVSKILTPYQKMLQDEKSTVEDINKETANLVIALNTMDIDPKVRASVLESVASASGPVISNLQNTSLQSAIIEGFGRAGLDVPEGLDPNLNAEAFARILTDATAAGQGERRTVVAEKGEVRQTRAQEFTEETTETQLGHAQRGLDLEAERNRLSAQAGRRDASRLALSQAQFTFEQDKALRAEGFEERRVAALEAGVDISLAQEGRAKEIHPLTLENLESTIDTRAAQLVLQGRGVAADEVRALAALMTAKANEANIAAGTDLSASVLELKGLSQELGISMDQAAGVKNKIERGQRIIGNALGTVDETGRVFFDEETFNGFVYQIASADFEQSMRDSKGTGNANELAKNALNRARNLFDNGALLHPDFIAQSVIEGDDKILFDVLGREGLVAGTDVTGGRAGEYMDLPNVQKRLDDFRTGNVIPDSLVQADDFAASVLFLVQEYGMSQQRAEAYLTFMGQEHEDFRQRAQRLLSIGAQ